MVHAKDVRVAEELREHRPARRSRSRRQRLWQRTLNDAVVELASRAGADDPRPQRRSRSSGIGDSMYYCFPHFFVLPMYSSASSYRFRPLGPGGDADGDLVADPLSRRASEPATPPAPEVWEHDDPALAADPRAGLLQPAASSKRACTPRASSTCGCRQAAEGGISNFERTDRRLPRRPPLRRTAARAARGERQPARAARSPTSASDMGMDGEFRFDQLSTEVDRGHPPHDRRVHPGAGRRPHRRHRRHLLPRRRRATSPGSAAHQGHDALREAYDRVAPRRAAAAPGAQHARRPTGTATRPRPSATSSSCCARTRAGRCSSWAATPTRCHRATAAGASTTARPSS